LKDADAERWVTDVLRNALSGNRCMVFCRRLRQMANEAGMDAAAAVMQNADFIVEMRKELTEGDIGKPKLSGKPTPNPT
jgi:chromosome condensin MukBEF complex kleisin-like MukF subunit